MEQADSPLLKSSMAEPEEPVESKESFAERLQRYLRTLGHFVRLLVGLMLDGRVERNVKIFVGVVLAYVFAPVDFIPEIFSGLFGMLDDFVLTAFALNVILNWVDLEVVKSHWRGDDDLLHSVQKTIRNAELLVPDAIVKKIQIWVGKQADRSNLPVSSAAQPKQIMKSPETEQATPKPRRKRTATKKKDQ